MLRAKEGFASGIDPQGLSVAVRKIFERLAELSIERHIAERRHQAVSEKIQQDFDFRSRRIKQHFDNAKPGPMTVRVGSPLPRDNDREEPSP